MNGQSASWGNVWPIGTERGQGGSGSPIPFEFDPTRHFPTTIPLSGTGTVPLPNGAWVEVTGLFSAGWTFQPMGAVGASIPLIAGACFPAPKDGKLVIDAAGVGTPVLLIWPAEVGPAIGVGRGYTSGQNPKAQGAAPNTLIAATRQALTTATPGTFTFQTGTTLAVVKAAAANAAAAYVGTNSTTVNVAGTRFELMQSDFMSVYGRGTTSFGFLGTTGEFLYVAEFG